METHPIDTRNSNLLFNSGTNFKPECDCFLIMGINQCSIEGCSALEFRNEGVCQRHRTNQTTEISNQTTEIVEEKRTIFTGSIKDSKMEKASGTWNLMGTDADTLALHVAGLMKTQEYNLESGTPVNGVYGIGSTVGRVLAGGLAKRYKYNLSVSDGDDGEVVLSLTPAMHGWSGGIIGASKLKKETKRLIALIDDSMAKD